MPDRNHASLTVQSDDRDWFVAWAHGEDRSVANQFSWLRKELQKKGLSPKEKILVEAKVR